MTGSKGFSLSGASFLRLHMESHSLINEKLREGSIAMLKKENLVVIFGVAAMLAAFSVGSSFAGNSYVARM